MAENKVKKLKVAWGITGAGDKIQEIIETMKDLKSSPRTFWKLTSTSLKQAKLCSNSTA
jgi:flavoprotein